MEEDEEEKEEMLPKRCGGVKLLVVNWPPLIHSAATPLGNEVVGEAGGRFPHVWPTAAVKLLASIR